MKKLFILLIITIMAHSSFGQMKQKEIDAIKNDTTLFYGLSPICSTINGAIDTAKIELYANIAKNCNPNAIYINGNGDKQLENIIMTFEHPIKEKLTERTVKEDDVREEYQYIITISRADFREMCNERKREIQNYITKGVKMENEACMEDALKSYYWALMLYYAHPQGKKLTFIADGNTIDYEWIVERISGPEGLLKSFNFIVLKENGIEENDNGIVVRLKVKTTTGKEVSNLRCEYNNGKKYVPYTVRNGELIAQLLDKNCNSLKIRVNYEFKEEAQATNAGVSKAIELIKVPRYSNNRYTVDLDKLMPKEKEEEAPLDEKTKIATEELKVVEQNRAVDEKVYLEKMTLIEKALRDRDIAKARECFSEEGYNMLDTLSRYGKMTVVGKPKYKFLKYKNEVLCRSIPMLFEFRNTVGFSQDVVFRFDTTNKVVTSLAFRLDDQAEYDIVSKTKWPEESRLVLINFLEDYQTAYALKRHRYLENIYSDDALIIVGRMVQRTVIEDRMTLKLSEEDAKLTEYDKNKYMEHLAKCFGNNEYIRLRFTETEFTRASERPDTYGVRVRQEYYSSTYGDVGYLFLLVDLRGKQPLIHVRAWQPDKVDLEKLMNMKDVRFN